MFGKLIECSRKPIDQVSKTSLGNGGTSYLIQKKFMENLAKQGKIANGMVLDLGIGAGEIGWHLRKSGYEGKLVGVDICEHYIKSSVHVYDEIYIANIVDMFKEISVEDLNKFDTIIWCDVLEHLSGEDGEMVLSKLLQTKATIILGTPNYRYRQSATDDNDYEEHISFWDFRCIHKMKPLMSLFTSYGTGFYLFDYPRADGYVVKYEESKIPKKGIMPTLQEHGYGEGLYLTDSKDLICGAADVGSVEL